MAAAQRLRSAADIHGRGESISPDPTPAGPPPLTLSPVRAQPPPPGPQSDWASVGNHRFEIHVTQLPPRTQHGDGTAVSATLPWRRHDGVSNATALVVLSSATSLAVPNCATVSATAESAEIVF